MHQTLEVPVRLPDTDDCSACAERLRSRLGGVNGIAAADLDAGGRRLRLRYDPALLSAPAVEARVAAAGLELTRRFRHATLRLEGLNCPECAGAVEHAAIHLPGVLSAVASFAAASLHVEYDAEATDLARIAEAVGRTGCRALAASEALVVRVVEMDCQEEVKAIEGGLRSLPGVATWQVNLLERTLRVQFDPAMVGPDAILAAIRGLGMTPELASRAARAVVWWRDPPLLSTATSGLFLGAAFAADWLAAAPALDLALHGVALCAGHGWRPGGRCGRSWRGAWT